MSSKITEDINKIKISTRLSRMEKKWKSEQLSWSDFVERLRKPVKTSETESEYHSYSKDKQDIIKDQGAFVGGVVIGGRRIKNSVPKRQLITLDADAAPKNLWLRFMEAFKCTGVLYSTHSR